eukprot:SAG31_NODE_760_length_12279_cov_2.439655_6_plen_66_part_00
MGQWKVCDSVWKGEVQENSCRKLVLHGNHESKIDLYVTAYQMSLDTTPKQRRASKMLGLAASAKD